MLEVGFIFWSHESQVLAAYSTFPALLETLFATFDVDRNGRIDLEARIGTNLRWRMAGLNDPSKRWRITSLQKRFIVGVVIFSMVFFFGWSMVENDQLRGLNLNRCLFCALALARKWEYTCIIMYIRNFSHTLEWSNWMSLCSLILFLVHAELSTAVDSDPNPDHSFNQWWWWTNISEVSFNESSVKSLLQTTPLMDCQYL